MHAARVRTELAELLADLAEIDERGLYVPAGYPSMYAWCMGELEFTQDSAYKRIRVARAARRFPVIFHAIAKGQLHLTAVALLKPHLTEENHRELLGAASHQTKEAIETLLAERFPRPDLVTLLAPVSAAPAISTFRQLIPEPVATNAPDSGKPLDLDPVERHAAPRIEPPAPPPRIQPLAPERFALQVTIPQSTRDKLRYAQELLSHQIPPSNLAAALDRVLDLAIAQLEKQKFAPTDQPRTRHSSAANDSRHIPAEVRRAVWERDGGQCTFVSDTGHRCEARTLIEFDHIDEWSRGGQASPGNIRLRCRAHNQYEAERTFGVEFMRRKRRSAAAG